MPRLHPLSLAVLAFALMASALRADPPAAVSAGAPAPTLHYNRDIRPILSENCFYCHGPDKNHRKGKFRLDDRDSAVAKGAINPAKPADGTLLDRIFSDDDDEIMPPPETHKVLTAAQKDLLKRWVMQGAAYEPFWAYIPPVRAPLPEVKNKAWVRNPIDAFILQTLESKDITPSPEADRRTLLRRLSLDLIGLPPTEQEVQAFLNDKSPDAYEKQVERLLASPHYGERMAVPWLDAVRFADTVGYHGDQNANVFPYRDYVINAFNSDKPFDQFTIEQLAGDLLEHPTTEQLIATGFNRLNMVTREGGAQSKEYLAKYEADRVRTLSGTFLGSTMGCCECHDHKYDPFTAKDFYSMEAFWADVKQWGIYTSYAYTPNPELRGFTNESPFPPEIVVDSPYLHRRAARFTAQANQVITSAAQKLEQDAKQRAAYAAWAQENSAFLGENPTGWVVADVMEVTSTPAPRPKVAGAKVTVTPPTVTRNPAYPLPEPATKPVGSAAAAQASAPVDAKASAGVKAPVDSKAPGNVKASAGVKAPTDAKGAQTAKPQAGTEPKTPAVVKPKPPTVQFNPDHSVLFLGKGADNDRLECVLHAGTISSVRLEVLPHEKHGGTILAALLKSPEDASSLPTAEVRVGISIKQAKGGSMLRPGISDADADFKDARYNSGSEIIGTRDAWRTSSAHAKSPQTNFYVLDKPVKVAEGDVLIFMLDKNALGDVRISVSPLASDAPADRDFVPTVTKTLRGARPTAAALQPEQTPAANDLFMQKTYLLSSAWDVAALAEYRRVREELRECRDGKSPTLVTVPTTQPLVTRLLPRGNWQDETAPIVQPATPHFLPQPPDPGGRRLNRLDLARWIVSADNPLTSRANVNRLWKQFFGNGIVMSVEDLGAQGDFPSHPELLDWLAVEFRESGWDVKHMVRLMVESSTYRQSSNLRPELHDLDPNNRLLASQNPRRLEAEFVRDNALSIAGLLNPEIGGPSVFPYQPAGYYANIQFPNREWVNDTDEREYRRGLYMHWQRTFLHPMLANFDAPSREDSVCTRNVSNTPQQALTLLNDPEFVEAARVLATKAVAASMADPERLEFVFQRALCRSPRANEAQSLREFLAGQREIYKAAPADAQKLVHEGYSAAPTADTVELAAWTNVCRVVLNLHETITRY